MGFIRGSLFARSKHRTLRRERSRWKYRQRAGCHTPTRVGGRGTSARGDVHRLLGQPRCRSPVQGLRPEALRPRLSRGCAFVINDPMYRHETADGDGIDLGRYRRTATSVMKLSASAWRSTVHVDCEPGAPMAGREPTTLLDQFIAAARDSDPEETGEWLAALQACVRDAGAERGLFLLERLEEQAQQLGIVPHVQPYSAYRNTIPVERQGRYPGDLAIEERLTAIVRWNALAMVVHANQAYGELGGHIASYASAAEIFEVGFNYFFRGDGDGRNADLVYFQPHSAPGVYSRAFLEGRLSEQQLANYRQELSGPGLSSYPHPWLMPDFWQFPTGSMGLGPLNAVYQARFMRYLDHRGLLKTEHRHVWGVFGDGEMDEPESIAGLTLAARERLDNLTFIINCNLQRLDGPVRGNGQIVQELESLFTGAGWNVIKVRWGSDWDALFARDENHVLLRCLASTVDGQYQTLGAKDGAYNIEHFFRQDPEVQKLVAHMSEREVDALKRGGHDFRKLHAAFAAARAHQGRPTVILAKTKKGFGMGGAGESRMTAHQAKKLDVDALKAFRDRFALPLSDDDVTNLRFVKPDADSLEMRYLHERRAALGGALPARKGVAPVLPVPPLEQWGGFALHAEGKEMSTTMAAVRMLSALLKDAQLGPRIVPIVADEARTFGMASLFRQIGIYSPKGQLYEPEDASSMLSYRAARDGQLLEEGITEAGALASWIAAGTSYSVHGFPMLPIYIYYSMFGFQRVGDLMWAAADQRARGILFGATAGRTTLGGEGLQHQDGQSLLIASTVPTCRAWDPCFAGEAAGEVFSVTSFSELARDAREIARDNRLQPGAIDRVSHVGRLLAGPAPVIAATDYVRAWPQLIAEYVDARYVTLGTDGFGRSDTRNALRR